MEKKKLSRIIQIIREEGMVANSPGGSGGFSSSSPAKGPTAGFDPVMGGMERRKKPRFIYQKGLRKNWKKGSGWVGITTT
jgi:hypothetical protein